MCKFIEVTDYNGNKYLQNSSRINAVVPLDIKWAEGWCKSHKVENIIRCEICLLSDDGNTETYYVLETYDQIKAMLM